MIVSSRRAIDMEVGVVDSSPTQLGEPGLVLLETVLKLAEPELP